MKKIITFIIVAFITLTGLSLVATPVSAKCPDGCVPVSILGDSTGDEGEKCACDSSKDDSGIIKILNDVVNIMTIGVGVLGILGITIVGVQYLTAGDSEEKTRKAKRRMFEIVIGLVAYVLIYAVLFWLIPGFKLPW